MHQFQDRCKKAGGMCWLQIKLRLMNDRIASPHDWIVVADSDEFFDFNALGPGIQVLCQWHVVSWPLSIVQDDMHHE